MSTIRAVIRNGCIEPKQPLTLPEGTEVEVSPVESTVDDDWDTSPEAIDARLAEMEAIEPLIFTDDQRAAFEAATSR